MLPVSVLRLKLISIFMVYKLFTNYLINLMYTINYFNLVYSVIVRGCSTYQNKTIFRTFKGLHDCYYYYGLNKIKRTVKMETSIETSLVTTLWLMMCHHYLRWLYCYYSVCYYILWVLVTCDDPPSSGKTYSKLLRH